mmetsp:Transcript_21463/g.61271  ORF Transcript_21463/g.61271 Transcript_21463/m.61271 type:complete len:257 (-) Transcript_21463:804-1574(-)
MASSASAAQSVAFRRSRAVSYADWIKLSKSFPSTPVRPKSAASSPLSSSGSEGEHSTGAGEGSASGPAPATAKATQRPGGAWAMRVRRMRSRPISGSAGIVFLQHGGCASPGLPPPPSRVIDSSERNGTETAMGEMDRHSRVSSLRGNESSCFEARAAARFPELGVHGSSCVKDSGSGSAGARRRVAAQHRELSGGVIGRTRTGDTERQASTDVQATDCAPGVDGGFTTAGGSAEQAIPGICENVKSLPPAPDKGV